ncbi:hypothetical protein B484DRAFT_115218 [Ochromonadaceae sp. CCMP2298]|nr:hypothetical protein B484DRAFT_115218 [Ochromonadaceae sp. CCMP2298]
MHDGQIALSKLEDNADQNNEGLLPFLIVVPLTARLIVISICLFFFTMCRVFHNKLVDWTSNIPGVDFSDAANVIYRGHKVSVPFLVVLFRPRYIAPPLTPHHTTCHTTCNTLTTLLSLLFTKPSALRPVLLHLNSGDPHHIRIQPRYELSQADRDHGREVRALLPCSLQEDRVHALPRQVGDAAR